MILAPNDEAVTTSDDVGGDWQPYEQSREIRVVVETGLDLVGTERSLRDYALTIGEDIDSLLDAAARHFDVPSTFEGYSPSEDEIGMMVEDERNAQFDD